MLDKKWAALAEIHFGVDDVFTDETYIYCLCSRVLLRDQVQLYHVEEKESRGNDEPPLELGEQDTDTSESADKISSLADDLKHSSINFNPYRETASVGRAPEGLDNVDSGYPDSIDKEPVYPERVYREPSYPTLPAYKDPVPTYSDAAYIEPDYSDHHKEPYPHRVDPDDSTDSDNVFVDTVSQDRGYYTSLSSAYTDRRHSGHDHLIYGNIGPWQVVDPEPTPSLPESDNAPAHPEFGDSQRALSCTCNPMLYNCPVCVLHDPESPCSAPVALDSAWCPAFPDSPYCERRRRCAAAEAPVEDYLRLRRFSDYWRRNGEALIWASWLDKYRDFIDPAYLEDDDAPRLETLNNSFDYSRGDDDSRTEDFSVAEVTVRERTFSYDSRVNPYRAGGAAGGAGGAGGRRRSCSEHDRPPTPRTLATDSMTNVTKTTLSSRDVSAASSPTASVSASLEAEPDADEAAAAERYWQLLWRQHYRSQQLFHMESHAAAHAARREEPPVVVVNTGAKRRTKNKNKKKKADRYGDSVGVLLESLRRQCGVEPAPADGAEGAAGAGAVPAGGVTEASGAERAELPDRADDAEGTGAAPGAGGAGDPGRSPGRGGPAAPDDTDGTDEDDHDDDDEDDMRGAEVDTANSYDINRRHKLSVADQEHRARIRRTLHAMGLRCAPAAPLLGRLVYRRRWLRPPRPPRPRAHCDQGPQETDCNQIDCELSDTMVTDDSKQLTAATEATSPDAAPDSAPNSLPEGCEEGKADAIAAPRPAAVNKKTYFDDDGNAIPSQHDGQPVTAVTDAARDDGGSEDREGAAAAAACGAELPPELRDDPAMMKYWRRRHSLFHRFDEGIRLDYESWFSVTPEQVSRHHARRVRCDLVVDAFCGAGGNAVQLALTCCRVIAIDIDPAKLALARHNAAVYGVADRIEFLLGDFFQLAPRLRADVVFLSPPWGGPQYSQSAEYDLETMLAPRPLSELLAAARRVSRDVAVYVPRHSRTDQLVSAARDCGYVEIEQNYLGRRLVALTAYYGDLVAPAAGPED